MHESVSIFSNEKKLQKTTETPFSREAVLNKKVRETMDALKNANEGRKNVELPTHECEVFPSEAIEIRLAKDLLQELAPGASVEDILYPVIGDGLLDESLALDSARVLIKFYNKAGPKIFRRTFQELSPNEAMLFADEFFSVETSLSREILHTLESAPTLSLKEIAVSYDSLDTLLGPHTAVQAEEAEKTLLQMPQEPTSAITPPEKPKQMAVAGKQILEKKTVKDEDESDYHIPINLKMDLPEGATESEAFDFYQALESEDVASAAEILNERARALGKTLDSLRLLKVVKDLSAWLKRQQIECQKPEPQAQLPESARSFGMYHAGFNRTRTIKPFMDILLKKMSGVIYANAFQEAEEPSGVPGACESRLGDTLQLARKLYKEVSEKGVPVFNDFAEYLAVHAEKGEFHVGRDTQTTTFVASNALRWGKMSSEERRDIIRHVDISRVLIRNTPMAVLKSFLEQEKINETMMGVDGGYSGSSPERVLFTLNANLTFEDASKQIRLIESKNIQRRFSPKEDYAGVVEWMEALPKYTERAQQIEKSDAAEFGKYLVVTKRRSGTERLLAWTVQHAVWRSMIPKGMKKEEPSA